MSLNKSSSPNKNDSFIPVKANNECNESINESSDDDFVSLLPKKSEIKSTIDALITTEENENTPTDKKTPSSTSSEDPIDDESDSDFENLLRIASNFWDDKPAAISKLKTEVEKSLFKKSTTNSVNNDDEKENNEKKDKCEDTLDKSAKNSKPKGKRAQKRATTDDIKTKDDKPARKRKVPKK